jgi:thymidine kinase
MPLMISFPANAGMGWIEVICGSMFSGKTEELIRRLKRAQIAKQKVQIFKPSLDKRYSEDHVTSHSLLKIEASNLGQIEEIWTCLDDNTRVIGIDEAQFFSSGLVEICQRIANRGLRVIVAGLDLDYRGEPFGSMPALMAVAESVTKMSAICTVCGGPASRSQRVSAAAPSGDDLVLLGAQEHYEARCRKCFEPPIL